ncbi:MAG TPA: MarR family winged helix-turn-helix transcriptional regulator [Acidimicrobiales bacterium]|nr:MarR family winged helix-turn-helix transcriptional regulator [Acidimicrobiales bacterium]
MPSRPTPAAPTVAAPTGPTAGRAAARLARVVENALGEVEMSLPQYRMLVFLAEGGSAAASALAGKLGVSRPSVTALVDGLVAKGLVERQPDPSDRRRVSHAVTEAGLAALDRADTAVTARLVEVAERVDAGEQADAFAGLAAWERALNVSRDEKLAGA